MDLRTQTKKIKMFVLCDKSEQKAQKETSFLKVQKGNDWEISPLDINDISRLCAEKLTIDTKQLIDRNDKKAQALLAQSLLRIIEKHPLGPPEIDPIKELKMNAIDFADVYKRKQNLLTKQAQSKCHSCPKLEQNVTSSLFFQLLTPIFET